MFTAPVNSGRNRAFTLLEIMLAVVIMGMMSMAIYRFVLANMTAVRVSSEQIALESNYDGLLALLTAQWQSLPPGSGALLGEPLKLSDRPRDEISWVTGPGPGLLTRYAPGEYRVTLRLRPAAKNSETMEIGLVRKPKTEAIGEVAENWIPLLRDVQSIEIKYFDPRVNTWVNKWTDTITLPRLIRLVIGRTNGEVPWEAVIPTGRTPL